MSRPAAGVGEQASARPSPELAAERRACRVAPWGPLRRRAPRAPTTVSEWQLALPLGIESIEREMSLSSPTIRVRSVVESA